ncbi:MAG TPA: PIN domain-containing protein [Verrucomicrobiales bacterium]|nr:PIN domain-containing protein [Verrucomicrobiales bacterium]
MIAACYDTNYLIKLQCGEAGSAQVRAHAATVDVICCALHGRAEFVSACHRKVREGQATSAQLQAMLAQLHADHAAGALQWLPVTEPVLLRVEGAYAAAPAALYLRAGDALHLAAAAEHGFTEIYSNDRHLLAAASHFGLTGLNLIP